jgi:tRNA(Arg) A34 adenosine deaminase TadA
MLSKKEERFIASARYYASLSDMYCHHGCVAVMNGVEIGNGYNSLRNYSKDKIIKNCMSCHAEICAVRNAIKRTKLDVGDKTRMRHVKLYLVRVANNGGFLDSRPCSQCYSQLKKWGIRNVIYSEKDCFLTLDLREDEETNCSSGFRYYQKRG